MILRFTKNIAINTRPEHTEQAAAFYKGLGLETQPLAEDFVVLGPAPFSCYVVCWEPQPSGQAEVALQFETDSIEEVKRRAEAQGAMVLAYGPDPHAPARRNLWFRDPQGVLINVTEMAP